MPSCNYLYFHFVSHVTVPAYCSDSLCGVVQDGRKQQQTGYEKDARLIIFFLVESYNFGRNYCGEVSAQRPLVPTTGSAWVETSDIDALPVPA